MKRHRLSEWTKKHNPNTYCLQGTPFKYNNRGRFKVNGCKSYIL